MRWVQHTMITNKLLFHVLKAIGGSRAHEYCWIKSSVVFHIQCYRLQYHPETSTKSLEKNYDIGKLLCTSLGFICLFLYFQLSYNSDWLQHKKQNKSNFQITVSLPTVKNWDFPFSLTPVWLPNKQVDTCAKTGKKVWRHMTCKATCYAAYSSTPGEIHPLAHVLMWLICAIRKLYTLACRHLINCANEQQCSSPKDIGRLLNRG